MHAKRSGSCSLVVFFFSLFLTLLFSLLLRHLQYEHQQEPQQQPHQQQLPMPVRRHEKDLAFDDLSQLGAPPEAEQTEAEQQASMEPEVDLYAVLNVGRESTEEEIKASYRRLSMVFHPDKHRTAEAKTMAESKFNLIQHAYSVLSDPEKRVIYDMYGQEGLDTMKNMQVGMKLKSPAEVRSVDGGRRIRVDPPLQIRAEYERERLKMKKAKMNQLLQASQTRVEVKLDSRTWFDEDAREEKRLMRSRQRYHHQGRVGLVELLMPEMTGLQIAHSNQIDLSMNDTISLSGVILSRGSRGGGYLMGAYRRDLSERLWVQVETAMGSASFVTVKAGGKLSDIAYYNCSAQFTTWPWQEPVPPALEFTLGRALSLQSSGYVTYRTGDWSLRDGVQNDSIEVGFHHTDKSRARTELSVTAGLEASGVQWKYQRPLSRSASMQTFVHASTNEGVLVGAGAERTIFSKNNRIGATLECNLSTGVTLKFKLSRLAQTLSIPILLADRFNWSAVLFGSLVPLCSTVAIQRFLLAPRLEWKRKGQLERMKERSRDMVARKKQEALEAQQLMQETYERKKEQEEREEGLIVVEAKYGVLDELEGEDADAIVDVCIPLQVNVQQAQLLLPDRSSKSSLLGFYDPCPWNPHKRLRVRYLYKGRLHEALVTDTETLLCPQRDHLVG